MKKKYTSKIKSLIFNAADRLNLLVLKDPFRENYSQNVLKHLGAVKMVNIGAGRFYHPLWVNLDYGNDFYATVQNKNMLSHDLSSIKPFPFDPDSVDVYYCSHVVEHLNNDSVENIFNEVYRSLKPNGVLRLVCPDMEHLYKNLKSGDGEIFLAIRPWGGKYKSKRESFLEHFCTILVHDDKYGENTNDEDEMFWKNIELLDMNQFLNLYSRRVPKEANKLMPHGHCNWFTFDKVSEMLRAAGFRNIQRSEFGKSQCVALRSTTLFDGTSPELSLYVEAEK